MKIEQLNEPYAGQSFHFRVTGGMQPTNIQVYIDQQKVKESDCPDPPCHEMFTIPIGTRGAELWIIARDTVGNVEQRIFEIADTDDSSSGMMSAES